MIRALCLIALLLLPVQAFAQLRVDITRGGSDPVPVAIPDFNGSSPAQIQMGRDIAGVITNNLVSSGLFRAIPPQAFIQTPAELQQGVRFADWRVLNAAGLVTGNVTADGAQFRVEFRLWDVFAGQQIAGVAYSTSPQNWRRIAHMISDQIYERLTGEKGYFDTRIVYVSESGPATNRIKRLAIMDQDGENHRLLTDGRVMVLTPRFSPNSQRIVYMAFVNNRARVFLLDLQTGRQEMLGEFRGLSFAPRFSPDGNGVVFSVTRGGDANIYAMNLGSRQVRQITSGSGIDTAPSYSPDGNRIVFESDRGGTQQLYTMNADGSGVQRISFGQGRYATPVWSPRGDLIAFTKMQGGQFFIGVMRPDGSGERLLAQGFHIEGPTWAPNGRVLMYFRDDPGRGGARIYSVDLTGQNERAIRTAGAGSDPAWSPLLP